MSTFFSSTVPLAIIFAPLGFLPQYFAIAIKLYAVVCVLYQLSCASFAQMVLSNSSAFAFFLSNVKVSSTIASSLVSEPYE